MVALFPGYKVKPKAQLAIKKFIAIISIVCFFALLIGFISMFSDDHQTKMIGICVFSIALLLTAFQIVVGIIDKYKK